MADITKLRIAYVNHVDSSSTTVTASTSATKFPAVNVKSGFRQVRWRATGKTSEWIKFRFGSPQVIQSFFLTDHNLTESAVVTLRGSTDNFVTVDEVIGAYTPTGTIIAEYVGDYEYSDAMLAVADPTNTAAYIEIGRVFLGPYVQMARNYNHGWTMERVDLSERVTSVNGVDSYFRKPQKRSAVLPFEHMDVDQRDALELLASTVGTHTPFFASLNYDQNPITETMYCRLDGLPTFTDTAVRLFDATLKLIEAL